MNRLDPRDWNRREWAVAAVIYLLVGIFLIGELIIPLLFYVPYRAYKYATIEYGGKRAGFASAGVALLLVMLVMGSLASSPQTALYTPDTNTTDSGANAPTPTVTTTTTHTIASTQTKAPRQTGTPASTRSTKSTQAPNPTASDTATAQPTRSPTQTPTDTPTATPTPEQSDQSSAPIEGGTSRSAVVTRVIDGDTVEVQYDDGETDTVRLIGVDSPETTLSKTDPAEFGYSDTSGARDHLYNWGQKAESFAVERLEGSSVRVVTDPQGDTRGYYGRLLGYIYVDGENFNKELVADGYARRYDDSSFTLKSEFGSLEADAQSADRRVWGYEGGSASTPTPTPESGSGMPTPPSDGDYDCGHFDSHEQAQTWFEENGYSAENDPHRLDRDGNGLACESS